MNRRHNLCNKRLAKEEHKEVKKGMKSETSVEKKLSSNKNKIKTPHKHKSKRRDSSYEPLESAPLSHSHKEGEKYLSSLQKQQIDKNILFNKKENKNKR